MTTVNFKFLQTELVAIQIQVVKIFTGSNKGELNGTVRSELKLFELFPCLIQTDFCNGGCMVSVLCAGFIF